jgi:hypothetical protein
MDTKRIIDHGEPDPASTHLPGSWRRHLPFSSLIEFVYPQMSLHPTGVVPIRQITTPVPKGGKDSGRARNGLPFYARPGFLTPTGESEYNQLNRPWRARPGPLSPAGGAGVAIYRLAH